MFTYLLRKGDREQRGRRVQSTSMFKKLLSCPSDSQFRESSFKTKSIKSDPFFSETDSFSLDSVSTTSQRCKSATFGGYSKRAIKK